MSVSFSLLFLATANVDYSSISGRLAFSSFRTSQCVLVRTRSDTALEGTEVFLVQLRNINPLPPFVTLARTNATVFIQDNDGMFMQ